MNSHHNQSSRTCKHWHHFNWCHCQQIKQILGVLDTEDQYKVSMTTVTSSQDMPFSSLLPVLGIKDVSTTRKSPQSNAICKHMHQTMVTVFISEFDYKSWFQQMILLSSIAPSLQALHMLQVTMPQLQVWCMILALAIPYNLQTESCTELVIGNLVIPFDLIMFSLVNPHTCHVQYQ